MRAVELAHDNGELAGEAESLNHLGDLYLDTATPTEAQQVYTRALTIATDIALALEEARALEGVGRCLLLSGRHAEGGAMLRQSLTLYEEIGSPSANRVRSMMGD
jgi:tetratricopeptide (TPR) repeat protein